MTWRTLSSAQDGFHIGRQIIEALSREHDGPSGQSGLAPFALSRQGAPGLGVELLGEVYRQQPDGVLHGRCRDDQRDCVQVSRHCCFLPSVAEYVPSASLVNDRRRIGRADG